MLVSVSERSQGYVLMSANMEELGKSGKENGCHHPSSSCSAPGIVAVQPTIIVRQRRWEACDSVGAVMQEKSVSHVS
jgi:hypothetical protein